MISLPSLSDPNPLCLVDHLLDVPLTWSDSITPPPSPTSIQFLASCIDLDPSYYPLGYTISPLIGISAFPFSFMPKQNPLALPSRPCSYHSNTLVSIPPSFGFFEGTPYGLEAGDIDQRAEEQELPLEPSVKAQPNK